MARFSNWLTRKLKRKGSQNDESRETAVDISKEMPFLPAERPATLTPTASQEHLLSKSTASLSPFFAKLPAEIRREIYLQAFGKRTIHIDLQHNFFKRGGYMTKMYPDSLKRTIEYDQPQSRKGWCWYSCVCHFIRHQYFYDDCCRQVQEIHWTQNEKQSGLPLGSFSVGLIGWLLACRQAYVETIDIVYRRNTFHINGITLPQWLPRLLLPQRLESITSVELVWDLRLPWGALTEFGHERWCELESSLSCLRTTFPGLQKLRLSIGVYAAVRIPETAYSDYECRLYPPLDSMVQAYGEQLLDCEVALSHLVQRHLMQRARAAGANLVSRTGEAEKWWRFWRCLREADANRQALGYWITAGTEDGPLETTACFGSTSLVV